MADQSRKERTMIDMGWLGKVRGRRNAPLLTPQTVTCPLCGEPNPASAHLCVICRGPLPTRTDQPAPIAK